MKVVLHIDENINEDKIEITAKAKNEKIEDILNLCSDNQRKIIGYDNDSFLILPLEDILYFSIVDKKVKAFSLKKSYLVKKRLYEIEDEVKSNLDFIKISQSVIINLKQVSRFELEFNGTIVCILKNGDKEYVSRRMLQSLKQRLGV